MGSRFSRDSDPARAATEADGIGLRLSDGQAFAALGSARADHRPATARFLADQETVRALAPQNRGLIGALHDRSGFKGKPAIANESCVPVKQKGESGLWIK